MTCLLAGRRMIQGTQTIAAQNKRPAGKKCATQRQMEPAQTKYRRSKKAETEGKLKKDTKERGISDGTHCREVRRATLLLRSVIGLNGCEVGTDPSISQHRHKLLPLAN